MNKDYIAFFDLDHTILNTSSGKILGIAAIRQGIFKKRKLIEGLFYSFGHKLGIWDGNTILPQMAKWMKGHPEQYIADFARQVFNEVMKYTIRREAVREIEMHRKNNAHLVMLSASTSFICKPVTDFLGLDDLICTDLAVEDNRFSGRPKGEFCYGEQKLVRSLDYVNANNLTLSNAYFYTDSVTDLPMLEAVDHPVAVSPDRKLAAAARARGWKIYDW